MSYLVEKYAVSLSKDDVIELFGVLEEAYGGNISRACRECGIQRKTRYDWARVLNINLSTKKRILKMAVKTAPAKTFDFLLSRSEEAAVEMFSAYLSHLYSKAMVENIDPRSFIKVVNALQKIQNEHSGLIWHLEEEVGDMMSHIRERAKALRVSLPEETVDTIRPSRLLEIIPSVVNGITRMGTGRASALARDLGIPTRLVQAMAEAIFVPTAQSPEIAQSMPQYNLAGLPPTADVDYHTIWGRDP